MLGRLGYTPNQLGNMTYENVILAIEGFNDEKNHELNLLRHQMWASLAAMGGKKAPKPKDILKLPTDTDEKVDFMSKEDFLKLAKKMA